MTTSHEKMKYFLTFINNFLKKTFFYTMENKFGVFDKFKVFKILVKIRLEKKIETIRCDENEEYNYQIFNRFCK